MTAHRRPLLIFATALLLPACLHVDATTSPANQQEGTAKPAATATSDALRKTQFAELLSRPGALVSTKSNARDGKDVKEATASTEVEAPTEPVVVASDSKVVPAGPPASSPPPDTPLLAALRAYTQGRPDQAIEFLNSLDKPNQDLVLAVLPALERGATLDLSANPTATAVLVDQLRTAAARIETRAALRIDVAMLCQKVDGYGRYEPRPKGKSYLTTDQAELYVQVGNLSSQPAVGTHGETYLIHARMTVEIRDAHEKLVDQPSIGDPRRLVPVIQYEKNIPSRSPIHDYHNYYQFPVPPTPGVYTVTMKIQDLLTPRFVKTAPIEFTVAGP
jgi:hypothetical protein